jgi:tRNA 2-selenouridine synthase
MTNSSYENLKSWAKTNNCFIDVRSPGEFQQGHLPGAINVPILDDLERAQVGTCYKKSGQEAAIVLGHKIVSGENKEKKIQAWLEALKQNPEALLMCFRGGLRSQITQKWLTEAGIFRPLVTGGYKACRQYLLDFMSQQCQENQMLVISGPTGSAKTHFIQKIASIWPTVDLEKHAVHRGSAFGKMSEPQSQQAVFENRFLFEMLQKVDGAAELQLPFAVEDESRLIGRNVLPDLFFANLRESPVLWLDVPLEKRTENTFFDYVLETPLNQICENEMGVAVFAKYKKALMDIQKKLGGLRTSEIMQMVLDSEKLWLESPQDQREIQSNKRWIQALLKDYYDPMYLHSLEKRQPKVFFKGSFQEAFECLLDVKSKKSEAPVRTKAKLP